MRRSDRLLDLVQVLRDGRRHRAHDMARRLGVSTRTIYRDMDTLMQSGVPVEGSRGVGYTLTAPVTLPPLNLSMDELEALHLGLAIVSDAGEPGMAEAAETLARKIGAVLPEERRTDAQGWSFATYPFADAALGFRYMPPIRRAIRSRQKLRLELPEGARVLRPLKLDYWGRVWTVTGWDEGARDFATLRVDRISALRVLPGLFVDEAGKTLADLARRAGPDPTQT
ncbi:YafY family transcriptional regulator [Mesobaculum littorinae]|uniref:YafY family transcriptional regulator n=1 Tax=Mesobaculum littorinae TaxID=2486419 RepID=A0A438ALQ8_9RHOB|nr:YafY family protein [Mesobaculum littorinae]RVV99783.1 YafY family transcriptional regulator [Mesobaculum littorinae]